MKSSRKLLHVKVHVNVHVKAHMKAHVISPESLQEHDEILRNLSYQVDQSKKLCDYHVWRITGELSNIPGITYTGL